MGPAQTYEGKAKRVTPHSADEVAIFYKDSATAFNGQKYAEFAGKGELNSQITEKLFHFLEKSGVRTHHVGRLDARTLAAKRAQMFALEAVVRFRVAGSLQKRTGLAENTPCEPPVVEFYYKRDDLGDPIVNDDHIRLLGIATPEEVKTLQRLALEAALKLRKLFGAAGIELVDMKFEFGKTKDGIVLADEISPDTCRFRDQQTGTILDKDRFRRDLGDLLEGYREVLSRLEGALKVLPHV
jgi:phosphoribosylaminoimidazole-succinocarboxamide synthase